MAGCRPRELKRTVLGRDSFDFVDRPRRLRRHPLLFQKWEAFRTDWFGSTSLPQVRSESHLFGAPANLPALDAVEARNFVRFRQAPYFPGTPVKPTGAYARDTPLEVDSSIRRMDKGSIPPAPRFHMSAA